MTLRWNFLLPGLPRPAGGLIAAYELANAIAAANRDSVCIVHLPTTEASLRSTGEIPWFTFHDAVDHVFLPSLDPAGLPEADILLYTVMGVDLCLLPDAGNAGARLLDQLQREESSAGLPMLFVQTLAMFSEATEMRALAGVGPKVCVASWLAGNLIHAGVPATEAVCVLNGVDHRTFRVVQPIDDRAPRIAMNYNPHPFKNGAAGIEALEQVGRDLGTPSIVYGTRHPAIPPRGGLQFADSPGQAEIAATILGQSSIYLQPSIQEGFGLSAVEAMACGCALVTTANGGSADYAVDGETAVVCDPEPGAMADAVASLVRDDNRRISIARNGVAYVKDFTWARSASQLTKLADAYLAEPAAFRHGRAVQLAPSVRHLV